MPARASRKLPDQPRLPDAGLAGDRDDRRLVRNAGQPILQELKLGLTAYQWLGTPPHLGIISPACKDATRSTRRQSPCEDLPRQR